MNKTEKKGGYYISKKLSEQKAKRVLSGSNLTN